jgi:hypothetical protein
MPDPICCLPALLVSCIIALAPQTASPSGVALLTPPISTTAGTVGATITTTLDTDSDYIRQLAFDGDAESHFASKLSVTVDDEFTLKFSSLVAVKSLAVTSGRPNGHDGMRAGMLLVSEDGATFREASKFEKGVARAVLNGRKIQAIRVRPAESEAHPLVIREITIESDPPVASFKYPVEFVLNSSDAPDMKPWLERAARVCEQTYPMINDELKGPGFTPPRLVTITLDKGYDGVAEASGSQIRGSVAYFRNHPKDVGALVHETVHVVQRYPGSNAPGWLVEGISDYIRFFKYEPGELGPIDPERAHYNDGYRTSAAFLDYVLRKYDALLILKLNQSLRDDRYTDALFKQWTGSDLSTLDTEWRTTLRRNAECGMRIEEEGYGLSLELYSGGFGDASATTVRQSAADCRVLGRLRRNAPATVLQSAADCRVPGFTSMRRSRAAKRFRSAVLNRKSEIKATESVTSGRMHPCVRIDTRCVALRIAAVRPTLGAAAPAAVFQSAADCCAHGRAPIREPLRAPHNVAKRFRSLRLCVCIHDPCHMSAA